MTFAKVRITVEHTGSHFDVMFNPEEYSLSKDNNFSSQNVPGLSSPLLQFVHGNLQTLDMELYFDTYEDRRDVREESEKVRSLMDIDGDLHAPPILQVSWASLQFRCVLARVNQKFTMFLEDGRPVRARLTVTFNEFIDPERQRSRENNQTADYTKSHTVIEGETISTIATAHYEDPTLWRPIAIANQLADVRSLEAGQQLEIPSLPYIDRLTGEVLE